MSETYILALDQGTTSSRAIVFDRAGNIRAQAQKEFRQLFPEPGQVEHDAQELWSTQIGVAQEAISRAGLRSSDIAAIGITNQRETVVLWDRASGQPVHNAIVWQDRRTASECDRLRAAGPRGAGRSKKPGCCSTPIFPPPRSGGCSTTSPARARRPSAANWPSAPSIRG